MEYIDHKIKLIDQLFKIRMNKNLEQLNITIAQMHVLIYLFQHKSERITQKILSENIGVKHSTMAGILNRLKEKELINIVTFQDNRRSKDITLTQKSLEKMERMGKHRNETESILLAGFEKDEIEQFKIYLDRVYNNLINGTELSQKDIEGFNNKRNHLERRHNND